MLLDAFFFRFLLAFGAVAFIARSASSPGMTISPLPKVSLLMTSCVSGRLRFTLTEVPGKSNSLWPKEAQSMAQ